MPGAGHAAPNRYGDDIAVGSLGSCTLCRTPQALQRVLITRNNDMIRVIYRWEVQPGAEEAFVDAWSRGTEVIRGHIKRA